ncbi:hypothetical protein [Arthrobacter sp. ISL-69]|uniref:hypothetical protein n=1 Tax=Arthrobacter sp. ISL-69 TaxID=2819113 RepID=UPI001BE8F831|nr:hypothetical protein [Arthrobacter sp. ISL-69]MBT2538970.1 hypothetical protein [Arthrobacter sp. ISL-69]
MGLIYDDPRLAALTLMRIAAEESEGPNELSVRMRAVLNDMAQRNGPEYLAELAIALARAGFVALEELAKVTGNSTAELLARVELEALEDLDDDG